MEIWKKKDTRRECLKMHSNLFMYLTAMSAVSIHNLVSNINEATRGSDYISLNTLDTNWTLEENISKRFNQCNGSQQSPININTSLIKENLNLRLGLTSYDKPISAFLINRFPTYQLAPISFKWPRPSALVSNSLARSFNPYADSHFTLDYAQFYWSQDDNKNSSVHRIDGLEYPAEIHFIHLNTAYSDMNEALARPDGLLIFAVMIVPSTHESYIFDKLLDELKNIKNPSDKVSIDEDSTWRSLLPSDTSKFYRYQGSMIMPPCHESVQWIVFEDKLKLGHKQLKRLKKFRFLSRDLRNNKDIEWSAQRRPMQQVHNRTIERSFSLRSGKERNRSRFKSVISETV